MAVFKLTLILVILGISLSLGVHGLNCYHCGPGYQYKLRLIKSIKIINCSRENGESKQCSTPDLVCDKQFIEGNVINRGCYEHKIEMICEAPTPDGQWCYCNDTDNCNGGNARIGNGGGSGGGNGGGTAGGRGSGAGGGNGGSTEGGRSCGVRSLPCYYFVQIWNGFILIVIATFSGSFIAAQ